VLVLNALLGLGTALAPAFVAVFVGLGFWWGLPVLVAVLLAALLVVCVPLPLLAVTSRGGARSKAHIPARFWLFAAFAVLYGICETMNGNWSQLEMTQNLGATATVASIALTVFWGMVTVGRILFAAIERRFPTARTYRVLPFVLAAAFAAISLVPSDTPGAGVLLFGVAGFGCSALLPLTISFGQEQLMAMSAAVPGGVIAFYQIGYGIAAVGAGRLIDSGVELSTIFGVTSAIALTMGSLAFLATHRPVGVRTDA
jgi:fucose permease